MFGLLLTPLLKTQRFICHRNPLLMSNMLHVILDLFILCWVRQYSQEHVPSVSSGFNRTEEELSRCSNGEQSDTGSLMHPKKIGLLQKSPLFFFYTLKSNQGLTELN